MSSPVVPTLGSTVPLPSFTDSVNYAYFLEPQTGATPATSYLQSFPAALYSRSPDSLFIQFMYTIMGPVGVGWLQVQLLELRLQLESQQFTNASLEAFYGNPFSFARITDEFYSDDVSGLLPAATLAQIQSQDEAYRTRALQFLNAVRLGTTPQGMALAATSGIGENSSVVENYRYLFDVHSDDPLGLPYVGQTLDLGEFTVVPQPVVSATQVQTLVFADTAIELGSNTYTITFNGYSASFTSASTAADIGDSLAGLPSIGPGNVTVLGGPAPLAVQVIFTGDLSNQNLPVIQATFYDSSSATTQNIPVQVATGFLDPVQETVVIGDSDRYCMQVALDYLRPVGAYPTFTSGRSTYSLQSWQSAYASSGFTQVLRFVTGSPGIAWPPVDSTHWIVAALELQAPQLQNSASQNYTGFHNVTQVTAYTDQALLDANYALNSEVLANYPSVHVGPFPEMIAVMPYFAQFADAYTTIFSAQDALAYYPDPLYVSDQTITGVAFIDGIYPADYTGLQGIPAISSQAAANWSSQGRPAGSDILEIDLGSPQAVNLICMEVTRKPLDIEIDYDLADQSPARAFVPVTPLPGFPANDSLHYDPSQQNPWEYLEFYFNDGLEMIFTRFIRIIFTRRPSTAYAPFLYNPVTQTQTPWSIDVRNLRIGRNVAPTQT